MPLEARYSGKRSELCSQNALILPVLLRWFICVKARSLWLTRRNEFELLGAVPIKRKAANRVEHFWLCGPCSSDMTLTYDRERGIQIIRKAVGKVSLVRRAAAS